jgi:hypothetical protein
MEICQNSQKIYDKILKLIFRKETSKYSSLFKEKFNLITNPILLKKRSEFFEKLTEIFQNNNLDLKDFENFNFKKNPLNLNVEFNFQIYVFEEKVFNYFLEKYNLKLSIINENKVYDTFVENPNSILITNENLNLDIISINLKDFENIILGNLIFQNRNLILKIIPFLKKLNETKILDIFFDFLKIDELSKKNYLFDKQLLEINFDNSNNNSKLLEYFKNLPKLIENFNDILLKKIGNQKIEISADKLMDTNDTQNIESIRKNINLSLEKEIKEFENKIIGEFENFKISLKFIFKNYDYPLKLDELKITQIKKEISLNEIKTDLNSFLELSKNNFNEIGKLFNFSFYFNMVFKIINFITEKNLNKIEFGEVLEVKDSFNLFLKNPSKIDYFLNSNDNSKQDTTQKVSILTGANSGGKTTLLEMLIQIQILSQSGIQTPQKNSKIPIFDEIIYLKKFSGTIGSGAFEQTIKKLSEIIIKKNKKLILIDEFEAITEVQAAAKILTNFLIEISKKDNFLISVSHLGKDLQNYLKKNNIKNIRIDAIQAEGINEKGDLIINHQPQFNLLGRSTPELIIKKILNEKNSKMNEEQKSFLENILK